MPTPPTWQFILTDLQGVVIGELAQASNRVVTLPLNRVPTASFSLPLWNPLAGSVLDGDCLLKCYRRDIVTGANTLVFVGPLVSAQEAGTDTTQSISVGATGPFFRLSKRLLGTSKAGFQIGNAASLVDLGSIAQQVLTAANGSGRYTGITNGTQAASTSGAYGPVWLKYASDAIAELSTGVNSFDFQVRPLEPNPASLIDNTPTIGALDTIPLIGQNRPDAIFEYGTARGNVSSYSRQISRDQMVNQAYISLSGWPDGVTAAQDLLFNNDTGSMNEHGVYEDVVGDNGVIDDTLRASILAENLRVRAQPRQLVTFTVATNARPTAFTDYNVGDFVRGRAVVRGSVRFDATFRIWGISFTIDQNGNESLDLQLVQDDS